MVLILVISTLSLIIGGLFLINFILERSIHFPQPLNQQYQTGSFLISYINAKGEAKLVLWNAGQSQELAINPAWGWYVDGCASSARAFIFFQYAIVELHNQTLEVVNSDFNNDIVLAECEPNEESIFFTKREGVNAPTTTTTKIYRFSMTDQAITSAAAVTYNAHAIVQSMHYIEGEASAYQSAQKVKLDNTFFGYRVLLNRGTNEEVIASGRKFFGHPISWIAWSFDDQNILMSIGNQLISYDIATKIPTLIFSNGDGAKMFKISN